MEEAKDKLGTIIYFSIPPTSKKWGDLQDRQVPSSMKPYIDQPLYSEELREETW